jgi:hypothetical protein
MHRLLLAILCLVCTTALQAQTQRTNLGTLTCTLAESGEKQATPPSEERAMRCAFKPTESGAEQTYTGTIRKMGPAQELQGRLVLIWIVQGPSDAKLGPGLLAQTYVGGATEGSPKGAAAKGLVGESRKEIVMQPETVQGGPETAAAITVMELKVETVPT